jgi:hypothetical protein
MLTLPVSTSFAKVFRKKCELGRSGFDHWLRPPQCLSPQIGSMLRAATPAPEKVARITLRNHCKAAQFICEFGLKR